MRSDYYLKKPPIPVPVYHHLLDIGYLLWATPEVAKAMVMLVERFSRDKPRFDRLGPALGDLVSYQRRLDAWDPEGHPFDRLVSPTAAALGRVRKDLEDLLGTECAWKPSTSALKTWFGSWANRQTTEAANVLLTRAWSFRHQGKDTGTPYLAECEDTDVVGLICDLPLLARHLRYLARNRPRIREGLRAAANALQGEADRLKKEFAPHWDQMWPRLQAGETNVSIDQLAEPSPPTLIAPPPLARDREGAILEF